MISKNQSENKKEGGSKVLQRKKSANVEFSGKFLTLIWKSVKRSRFQGWVFEKRKISVERKCYQYYQGKNDINV